jgi:hypothetical protein
MLVSLWLAISLALARRDGRVLKLYWPVALPFAAGLIDLLENTGISILLIQYPQRLDGLATLTGDLTTAKHLLYAASLLATVVEWGLALLRRG